MIYVRAGQYRASDAANGWFNDNFVRPDRSGTQAQPIAVLAYPGEVAELLLDRPSKLFGNYESVSDWTLAGFRIVLAHTQASGVAMVGPPVSVAACNNPASVQGYAQRVRIVALDIDGRDTGGMAGGSGGDIIEIGTSRDVQVLGNYIHNTSPANPSEPTHAIYLSAPQQNTEVGWNRIQNIPHSRALIQLHEDSFGGACWGKDSISDIKVHDNLVDNVAGQAFLMDGGVGAVEAWNNTFTRIHLANDHRYEDVVALRGSGNRLRLNFHDNVITANPNYTDAGYIFDVGNPAMVACPMSLTFTNNRITLTGESSDVFVYRESWCASSPAISGSGNTWTGGTAPAVTPGP
ncbi:MAG: right-handed parallel beta-helix repeat-containing protein [Gammaproteobacteria bacterium]|nr:right-handed parallel beta-helix repeat-containing protein [Gammaproteobacteria bacterium]